ncbi:UNVERIFIED_CONTAM: hypothetical protein FKN15_004643 [Acipenser sinensis]
MRGNQTQSASWAGLKFGKILFERQQGRDAREDCLGVQLEMIVCLQRNGTENYVDVTMVGETSFKKFLQRCKEKKDDAPLSNFKVESLSRNKFQGCDRTYVQPSCD